MLLKKLSLKIVIAMIGLAYGQFSQAGLSKFDNDSFNQMLNESIQNDKALREELRANAGFKKEKENRIREKQFMGFASSEDVVNVPTEVLLKDKTSKKKFENSVKVEQEKQKRFAEELDLLN